MKKWKLKLKLSEAKKRIAALSEENVELKRQLAEAIKPVKKPFVEKIKEARERRKTPVKKKAVKKKVIKKAVKKKDVKQSVKYQNRLED